jgi:two-component system sensor histidine kinase VanS
MSRFTRYLNEVNTGLDKLLEEGTEEITLSREMEFIEKKLNKVKSALKKREMDAQNAEQRLRMRMMLPNSMVKVWVPRSIRQR